VREALSELEELLFSEARGAGWEYKRPAEKAALLAARRLLATLDQWLNRAGEELNRQSPHDHAGGTASPGVAGNRRGDHDRVARPCWSGGRVGAGKESDYDKPACAR
jgi:hypothetical protein